MKKQILLPVLIAVFAIGSAFASNHFATGYYIAGDNDCDGTFSATPPCPLGTDAQCKNAQEVPFYQKADPNEDTSEENPCVIVQRKNL